MKLDKTNFGKFLVKASDSELLFIVCGYDYLDKRYIVKDSEGTLFYLNDDEDIKMFTYLEAKKVLEDKLSEFSLGIFTYENYKKHYENRKDPTVKPGECYEYYRIFRRLRENSTVIEKYKNDTSIEAQEIVRQATKGFRRALKRLHRYIWVKADYYDLLEVLEELDYNRYSIEAQLTFCNKLEKKMEKLEEMHDKYKSIVI